MRIHRFVVRALAAAVAVAAVACGAPGEVPPPGPRDDAEEIDPGVSPSPPPAVEPLEDQ